MNAQILNRIVLLLLIATSLSCYKEDKYEPRNASAVLTKSEMVIEKDIPEIHSLLGFIDTTGEKKYLLYDVFTGTIKYIKYANSFSSYSFKSSNEIFVCNKDISTNDIYLINILDSSIYKSYNYPYLIEKCLLSKNKIYVLESTIGPSKLHVYNMETNVEIDNTYVGYNSSRLSVSHNGTHIYTTNSSTYTSYSNELSTSNILNELKAAATPAASLFVNDLCDISDNGKILVSNTGEVYDEYLNLLYKISSYSFDPLVKCAVSNDSKFLFGFTKEQMTVYDSGTFQVTKELKLPQIETMTHIISVVPYTYGFDSYAALTYSNAFNSYKTVIHKW